MATVHIGFGFHVNCYHSYRGDSNDALGFGGDLRPRALVIGLLVEADGEGVDLPAEQRRGDARDDRGVDAAGEEDAVSARERARVDGLDDRLAQLFFAALVVADHALAAAVHIPPALLFDCDAPIPEAGHHAVPGEQGVDALKDRVRRGDEAQGEQVAESRAGERLREEPAVSKR